MSHDSGDPRGQDPDALIPWLTDTWRPSSIEVEPPAGIWRRIAERARRTMTRTAPIREAAPKMLGFRLGTLVLGFLASVLIARILGPADRGVYGMVLLLALLAASTVDFGMNSGTFLALARKELHPSGAYTNVSIHILLTTVALGVPTVVFLGPFLARTVNIPYEWFVVGVLLLGPMSLHALMSTNLLIGIDRAPATYWIPFLQQLLLCGGALAVLALSGGLTAMVWMAVVVTAVIQGVYFVAYHVGGTIRLRWERRPHLRAISFGFPLWVASVMSLLHMRADQLLVGNRLGPEALGYYALAVSIGELLWSLDLPLTAAMQYRIASESRERATVLVHQGTRIIILVMCGACVATAIAAPVLLPLVYGEAFAPAVPALLAYLPGVLFLSIARTLGQDLGYQRKRTDVILYANAFSLTVNLVLLFLLLRPFGIVGAATASSASYLSMMIAIVVVHRRLAGVSFRAFLLPTRGDVGLLWSLVTSLGARLRGGQA